MDLKNLNLLAKWKTAQQMVRESMAATASAYEKAALPRRLEWATELGMQCLKAGLLNQM